jgi:hypothetical protein
LTAEKCACPLTAEGDSPIFAANTGCSCGHTFFAAKIGTVPCERLQGEVKPEKSTFVQQYRAAYEGLWRRVGTDQFVWCCSSADDWPHKCGYCQWTLEVPEERIFRIVDGMVWAGIRGEPSVLSPRLREELMTVAMQRFPGDTDGIYPWVDEQVQKLMHPPGDAWDALFLSDPHHGGATPH